jgi:biopolymer transport protein TolR
MWSALSRISAREAKRRSSYRCMIDAYGLASVLVAILALFMVMPTQHQDLRGGVDLFAAQHSAPVPNALREDAIAVEIVRDGQVYLQNRQVRAADLPAAIRNAELHGSEHAVYLSVDERARYGDVKPVIDELRAAGISKVVILTNRVAPPPRMNRAE